MLMMLEYVTITLVDINLAIAIVDV